MGSASGNLKQKRQSSELFFNAKILIGGVSKLAQRQKLSSFPSISGATLIILIQFLALQMNLRLCNSTSPIYFGIPVCLWDY